MVVTTYRITHLSWSIVIKFCPLRDETDFANAELGAVDDNNRVAMNGWCPAVNLTDWISFWLILENMLVNVSKTFSTASCCCCCSCCVSSCCCCCCCCCCCESSLAIFVCVCCVEVNNCKLILVVFVDKLSWWSVVWGVVGSSSSLVCLLDESKIKWEQDFRCQFNNWGIRGEATNNKQVVLGVFTVDLASN